MNNTLVYLACPYSHSDPEIRNARFHVANKAAGRFMADGLFVFSPISMSHPIAEDAGVPGTWEFWRMFDTAMIARCQRFIVVAIDGLNESVGVRAEISIARDLGLDIEYAIPLTKGYFALIDEEDFEAVNAFKWSASVKSGRVYAGRAVRKGEEGYPKRQYLHQFLIPGEKLIDHRSGKAHDNRRQNLRPATHQQNLRGFQRKRKGATAKFRGVSWDKDRLKWMASITLDGGRTKNVGRFSSEEEAARAYDAAARKYYGDFASPNFL